MAQFYSALTEDLKEFIRQQQLFFVATAAATGSINLSPKGMDSFKVISDSEVAWLNLTGSGNETAAHIQQHNRMTLMFCSFAKQPLILRLYGSARMCQADDNQWQQALSLFPSLPGARQVFFMAIEKVQTSCGFAVPKYEFVEQRATLKRWAESKGEENIRAYWKEKNQQSIDGFATQIPIE